jgi:glycosyl transferase, family 25
MWHRAADESEMLAICEDDAVFHSSFLNLAPQLISTLPDDWDFVMWGWNFDSILIFDLMPGISPCLGLFDQAQLRSAVSTFQARPVFPNMFRLLQGFGLVCYTLSAKGAHRLLELSLPIRPFALNLPMIGNVPNFSPDVVTNAAYPKLNAYVSVPPLVVTRNEHETSTTVQD